MWPPQVYERKKLMYLGQDAFIQWFIREFGWPRERAEKHWASEKQCPAKVKKNKDWYYLKPSRGIGSEFKLSISSELPDGKPLEAHAAPRSPSEVKLQP